MDIDDTLKLALYTMKRIQDLVDAHEGELSEIEDYADTLAESVDAINKWLVGGGFLPQTWKR